MIRRLIRMGNVHLQTMAQPVLTFNTLELHTLISDLFDTMKATGGVGIAAPQIGVPLQVIVFGFEFSARYPFAKAIPETVLINPSIASLGAATNEEWEGCLSVKGIRGLATRYTHIRYQGYDATGNFFEREVSGFHARVVQHEVDHLQGTLFIERVQNLKYLGFEEEISHLMEQKQHHLG